jgi:uncharacterized membrane protein
MNDGDPDPAVDMAMTDEIAVVFVTGCYDEVAGAKNDFQAVKDLHYEINALDEFDAVVIGRQDSGDVKVFKKHEQSIRYGRLPGGRWGLACGLAVALFPAAAIGTGLLVGSPDLSVGLMVFGAEVANALGRNRLVTLGSKFDAADAGLIVAVDPGLESAVRRALGSTDEVRSDATTLNLAHLERTARDGWREAVA